MSEPESASLDARRRRLTYRATHRGTYENDILIGGFVQRHVATLSESELVALEELLELPENDLADWLTGRLPIPAAAETPMLRRVRDEIAQSHFPSPCGRELGGGGGARSDAPSPQPPPARGGGGARR
ncbi:MAG TPA: succinate dehydrogenase assembly factor 2 [Acetobacteraceae bacterium]|nr:succinate dehydrogenase assembly factor 2 [Acetobacteraceae bacterium]